MLRAPDRAFTLNDDLSFQYALEAVLDCTFRACAMAFVNEGVSRSLLCDVAQEFHHAYHSVVVVGDVCVVASTKRVILRPAAVRILGFEQIVNAFEKSLFVALKLLCAIDARKICQLRVGCTVVNRGIVCLLLQLKKSGMRALIKNRRHVYVLGPTARVSLVEQQVIGDAHCLVTAVPLRILPETVAPLYSGRRRRSALAYAIKCQKSARGN